MQERQGLAKINTKLSQAGQLMLQEVKSTPESVDTEENKTQIHLKEVETVPEERQSLNVLQNGWMERIFFFY